MSIKALIKQNLSTKQKSIIHVLLSKIKLLFFKKKVGKNSYIDSTVNVLGWAHVSIGENTLIGAQSWLNVNERKESFNHIKVGNNCYVGKRTLISPAKKILISDYCLIGDDCKLVGANHIYEDPMKPYAFTGAVEEGEILIGVNVWIGTMVCIIGNVSIGHGSIVGAASLVTKSIPPFSIAVGNPCKVIKRYSFKQQQWIEISKWNNSLEIQIPSEEKYLEQMKNYIIDVDKFKYAASHNFSDLI